MVLTNCSNNDSPWQFPEKLIPVAILKAAGGWGCWRATPVEPGRQPRRKGTRLQGEVGVGAAFVASRLTTAAGAALIGADAKELHQEFRRVLAPVASMPLRGSEAMGFRELLYFRVVGCLGEQGVRLTHEQKREIYTVFERKPRTPQRRWLHQEGKLVLRGAVPLSMDLTLVSRELRCRYRLFQRPQGLVA